jgi:hypothetical protein
MFWELDVGNFCHLFRSSCILWNITSENPLEIQFFWERDVSKLLELKIKPKIGLSQLGWIYFPPVGQALKDFSVHAEN